MRSVAGISQTSHVLTGRASEVTWRALGRILIVSTLHLVPALAGAPSGKDNPARSAKGAVTTARS